MKKINQRRHVRHSKYGRKFVAGKKIRMKSQSVMKDYLGMNREAAKAMGFSPMPKMNEIFIAPQNEAERARTIKHEVVEEYLMREKGMPYWTAHKIALKEENHPIRQLEAKYG